MPDINPQLISVRDLIEEDIPHVINYWHHSPPGFIEGMGVDLEKLLPEEELKKSLIERIRVNRPLATSKLNALAILYDGKAIGAHTIKPLVEGDNGIFHAHIWDLEMRKKGIALSSYPKACQVFMKRFNLKRILFKTPVQNIGAIRVKEKLGIRYIGEEIVGFGIVREGTLAKVFELTSDEAEFLASGFSLAAVDLSQLQRNFSMSIESRLTEHQNALDLVFELERAGKRLREKSQ